MKFLSYLVFPVVLLSSLHARIADEPAPAPKPTAQPGPWLTGPLIAPSGHVMPTGHINYEPYFFWSEVRGNYNANWHRVKLEHKFTQVIIQPTFQWGILPYTEFDFAPQIFWQHTNHQSQWVWGDMPFGFAFPIYVDKNSSWPDIKLKVNANAPWGKYQHLDPKKLGTDDGGVGSWNPSAGVVLTRLFHPGGVHYLSARWFLQYVMPTPVHVKGYNNYGGNKQTRGKVYPGNIFFTDVGLEFTLTQRWALALDISWQHNNKNRFKGRRGGTKAAPALVNKPSSEQFTLAPAVEYNWNEWLGAIGGAWFTFAGRNSAQFMQWVIAVNIYV